MEQPINLVLESAVVRMMQARRDQISRNDSGDVEAASNNLRAAIEQALQTTQSSRNVKVKLADLPPEVRSEILSLARETRLDLARGRRAIAPEHFGEFRREMMGQFWRTKALYIQLAFLAHQETMRECCREFGLTPP